MEHPRLERLEALVARVAADMEVLEAQMDEAEATVGGGPLKQVTCPRVCIVSILCLTKLLGFFSHQADHQHHTSSTSTRCRRC